MKQEGYYILVSEPWDYESPDGPNLITGTILDKKSNKCLIFKSNCYLQFDEVNGDVLVLTPRHSGYDFSTLSDEIIAFNGSVLLKNYDVKMNENELMKNSKFVIIGSLRKR